MYVNFFQRCLLFGYRLRFAFLCHFGLQGCKFVFPPMACSVQRFSSPARFSRASIVPGSKPFLTDTFYEVKQGEVRRVPGISEEQFHTCNRLTCQNCNSTRTRVSWAVQNQTLRPHGSMSLSRFATFTLSRALSTATSANETRTQKLERIADELLDLTKIERHDYSILFRLKMGLNRYGPAVSGIGSASSESGPASADSKVVEKTAFDIKIEKFDAAAKIKIIKEVRTFTDLGLKEAKELVEKAPVVVKKGVTKEEAGPIVDKLKELGATVVLE
ncbi:unnamed protein product [Prunus brigantina]